MAPIPSTYRVLTSLVWDNVYGFNFKPIKDVALAEPLVDTVELKAVVSDPCPVFELDLYTITTADLAFDRPFKIESKRDDYIHAMIAWFDIEFSACHKPIRFSTGPHTKYTHWKQTVFYLRQDLVVEQGETVEGRLSCKPNQKNKRDLDISLTYKLNSSDPMREAEGGCEYKM